MTRRALVTGITGFIGGELASRLLAEGWQVHALVRPSSDLSCLHFRDKAVFHSVDDGTDLTAAIRDAKPDLVFHLASLYLAEHQPHQVEALVRSNILFPALIAEAMAANGVRRIINTGTAWQHFEGETYRPVNLYAATKQAAEDLFAYYADARELSVITLKLFDTFGRTDTRRKLVQILAEAAGSGETLDMSPGQQVVDITHVDDVVSAFVLMADRLLSTDQSLQETYYVSGQRQTVRDLAGLVSDAMGLPISANFGGRPYRSREVMQPVNPKAHEIVPGWERQKSLEQEIPKLSSGYEPGQGDGKLDAQAK
jgi:nucleoside-diphosphate-sugar epimerase